MSQNEDNMPKAVSAKDKESAKDKVSAKAKESAKDLPNDNTATEASKEATIGTKREGKTEGDATKEVTASEHPPKQPQVDQIVMIFPGTEPAPTPTPNNWAKMSEKSAKDNDANGACSKTDVRSAKTEASAKSKEPISQTEADAKTEMDKKKEEPVKPPPTPPVPIIVKIEQPKTQPTSSDPPKSDPPPTPQKKKCCPLWCC